jgi:hypothetical protein
LKGLDPQGSSADLARQNDLLQERFALQFGGQAFDLAKAGDAGREKALNDAVATATAELKRLQALNGEIDKRLKDRAAAGDLGLVRLQDKVQNDIKMMNVLVAAGQQAQAGRPALEFGIAGAALAAGIVESARNEGPYAHLTDGTKVEPGRHFQPQQKEKILDANSRRNGGKLMSDDPNDPWFGKELVAPPKGKQAPGEFADVPDNQAQIDHIIPCTGPDGNPLGTNAYSNARVVSAQYNRMKSNKLNTGTGE